MELRHTLIFYNALPWYRLHYFTVTHCRLINIIVCAFQEVKNTTRVYHKPPSKVYSPDQGTATRYCLPPRKFNARNLSKTSAKNYRPTKARHDDDASNTRGSLLSISLNTPIVLFIRRHQDWSYMDDASAVFGPEELIKFLRSFQPRPLTFNAVVFCMGKSLTHVVNK